MEDLLLLSSSTKSFWVFGFGDFSERERELLCDLELFMSASEKVLNFRHVLWIPPFCFLYWQLRRLLGERVHWPIFFLTIESGNWEIIVSFLSFLISFGWNNTSRSLFISYFNLVGFWFDKKQDGHSFILFVINHSLEKGILEEIIVPVLYTISQLFITILTWLVINSCLLVIQGPIKEVVVLDFL